jgi:predicted DNA-binding protein (MmcQ/YjbR family)
MPGVLVSAIAGGLHRDASRAAMTVEEFNAFCGALPATSHGVQWGGAQVWKVGPWEGGKVFVVAGWERGDVPAASFKVSDIGWEVLRDAKGCRPAPYLASRGMKWIQADLAGGLSQREIEGLISDSHRIVAAGLSRKKRAEWGLG